MSGIWIPSAAGLPLVGVVILAALDRLTDTFRSALNVIGPTANAAILEKWEFKRSRRAGTKLDSDRTASL